MAKPPRPIFVCQQCGYEASKWLGRCPGCNEWNTLVESLPDLTASSARLGAGPRSEAQPLSRIDAETFRRLSLPFEEFNRVLGGGVVPGSLVLLGGDPGIGKSTLLLQVVTQLSTNLGTCLYVSGEESRQQIRMRADRLGLSSDHLYLLSETDLSEVLRSVDKIEPRLVVIDSIQTIYAEDLSSAAGSVAQIRECALRLMRVAKSRHIPVLLVGHVTKEGMIAGPRVLEHIVDTVLYLEGERFHSYRLLRSVKNRFGSTNEVGVFEMTNEGLAEVTNPSQVFLAERPQGATGSTVVVTVEGTRPILVEIQALTSPTSLSLPRRTSNGIDMSRVLLLTAVLNKRVGFPLSTQDIFVNVVGGLKIGEPSADLGVAISIASSYRDKPVDPELIVLGEVGLSGEIRTVNQIDKRLAEAAKLGFRRGLLPRSVCTPRLKAQGLTLFGAGSVNEAIEIALQG
ncbi:MAG: DNA repair protein RadA [Chloroflexota bacterium]|nr:MAG: DNA repair protein RadA [Chloroflexota bacterium]